MKFKSQIATQVSGSVGGTTFSHNRGGLYMRARSIPVNPASPLQTVVRNAFTTLVNNWTSVLTGAQRNDWSVYATNTPVIDKLGDPITLTGQQMYIRNNTPRIQAAFSPVNDAPTTFNLGDFTAPTYTAQAAADTITVAFTSADAWDDEDDSAMLIFASRPQNPSVIFFKGPYRFAGSIDGDSVTPPTNPAVLTAPFALTAGQIVHMKASVMRADGRLSTPFRGFGVAV